MVGVGVHQQGLADLPVFERAGHEGPGRADGGSRLQRGRDCVACLQRHMLLRYLAVRQPGYRRRARGLLLQVGEL